MRHRQTTSRNTRRINIAYALAMAGGLTAYIATVLTARPGSALETTPMVDWLATEIGCPWACSQW